MKIVMDELQYQELEILIDILEGMLWWGGGTIVLTILKQLYIENIEKENNELIKNSIFI